MLNPHLNVEMVIRKFEEIGLIVDDINTDRNWVRCSTTSKPHKKNGAYTIFPETGVCWCKNWETGEEISFKIDGKELSGSEKSIISQSKRKIEVERFGIQEVVAKESVAKWDRAIHASSTAYTRNKGVKCYGVRRNNNALIIPLRDKEGKIWSLQYINDDGSKRFTKGGKKKGCFFEISGNEKIVLCEGYATGASIHEATGYSVIVCFDADNMIEVGKSFKTAVIGADNDLNHVGEIKAKKTGKKYYLPPIIDGKSTDFNDLHRLRGLDAVKECFENSESLEYVFDSDPTDIVDSVPLKKKEHKLVPEFIDVVTTQSGTYEKVNRPYLAEYIRKNERFLLVQGGTGTVMLYWYEDGVYSQITKDIFKSKIKKHITDYNLGLLKMSDVEEVYKDLMTDQNFCKDSALNTDKNIINFRNGILNLSTRQLEPHSPEHLSTLQIPCNYCKENKVSPQFDKFMDFFCSSDEEKIKFYLQWIGAVISNIPMYVFKKALLIIGKPHSGKSIIQKFLAMCLGEGNYSSIDLSYLEKNNFALSSLHNKRLGMCGDMSFMKNEELKNFKNIIGGDSIKIEYKGQMAFAATYKGALMFNSNFYPRFGGDTGNAVFDRFIVLSADNVKPEEERKGLFENTLFEECEAIISRAIDEVYNVIDNGYKFNIPKENIKMIDSYKAENSHAVEFYKAYCIDRPVDSFKNLKPIHDFITQKLIYAVFREWSIQRHGSSYVTSKAVFEKEISNYLGLEKITKKTNHGNLYYYFIISSDACKEYRLECITQAISSEVARLEKEFIYAKENVVDDDLDLG